MKQLQTFFALLGFLCSIGQLYAQPKSKDEGDSLFKNCYWQAQNPDKSSHILVVNWFNYPIIRVKFASKENIKVENQHLSNLYNQLVFAKDELSYSQTYPHSNSQYLRLRVEQNGKAMYIYGVEHLLQWRQFSECFGRNTDCLHALPTVDFSPNSSLYLDQNNIPLLQLTTSPAVGFQLPKKDFFDIKTQYASEYIDFSHRTVNNQLNAKRAIVAYFGHYIDGQNPMFGKYVRKDLAQFEHWGGIDELIMFNGNSSYCNILGNQHYNWVQWLDKSQQVDLAKDGKMSAYELDISTLKLNEQIAALSAQRAADGQLIGRYWDSKGRLMVLQSNDEGLSWKSIYNQPDSIWQTWGRRLQIHQNRELLIPTIDGLLYGRYENKTWQFEKIECKPFELLPKHAHAPHWLGISWAGKDKIRILLRYNIKRGMSGDEYQFGSLISNENGKGWEQLMGQLPEPRSLFYQPQRQTWLLAGQNYLIMQDLAGWRFYPVRNEHLVFINDSSYLEIHKHGGRSLTVDSLEKRYQFDQIKYLIETPLHPDLNTLKINPLAEQLWAAGMDSTGTIYALTGVVGEQVSTVHIRDQAYQRSPKLLYLQVLGKDNAPLSNAKVVLNNERLRDTMLYDSSSRQLTAWYYLDLDKAAIRNTYQTLFAAYWADSFSISAEGYRTSHQNNSQRLQWNFKTSQRDGKLILPLENNRHKLYLYHQDIEIWTSGNFHFPIKRHLSHEIAISSPHPLPAKLLQLCEQLNLQIDSSQASNISFPIRPIRQWGNNCEHDYYYLYKADKSDFGLWECEELRLIRDSVAGIKAGNRLELALNPYDLNGQHLGLAQGIPRHPNDNTVAISTEGNPVLNQQIVQAAQRLGFTVIDEKQQGNQRFTLRGRSNWTYKMLIKQADLLTQEPAWGRTQLYFGQGVLPCPSWD